MTPQEQELSQTLAQVNQDMKQFGQVLPGTRQALLNAQTGIRDFGMKADLASQGLSTLAAATGAYARAVYQGNTSATAANAALDQFQQNVNLAAAALVVLTPGGVVIKSLVAAAAYITTKVFGAAAEAAKLSNEMAAGQFKLFQDISKSGATASDGLEGMYGDLQKMGIMLNEFPEYGSLIKQSSADLATLGGTVRQGAKALALSSAQVNMNREELFRTGMTQEDINDATMSYLKLQNQLGRNTKDEISDTVKLGQSARAYIDEQNKLTMITGQDRKSREAARNAAMQEERYAAKMRAMTLAGNTEGVKAMTTFNDYMSDAAPEIAAAARDMVAGGPGASEAAAKLQRSAPEAFATLRKMLDSTIKPAEAAQTILKQVAQTGDSVGTVLGLTGNFNDKFISMNASLGATAILQTDIVEKMKKADEEYGKQRNQATQNTADQAQINEGQRQLGLKMQGLVESAQPQLQAPNRVIAAAAKDIAKELQGLVDVLKKYNGQAAADLKDRSNEMLKEYKQQLSDKKSNQASNPTNRQSSGKVQPAPDNTQPNTQNSSNAGGNVQNQPPVQTDNRPAGSVGILDRLQGKGRAQNQTPAPQVQPAPPSNNTSQQMQNIRNLIQRAEITPGAENPYDIQQGEGKKAAVELTKMTVDQVLALQDQRRKKGLKKGESTAVGAYQIVQGTLKEKIAQLKIQGDEMFDKDLQDRLADSLIKQAGYDEYAANPTPDAKKAFVNRLSGLWAGIPKDAGGQTGLPQNQNKATIDFETAINSFGDGGIALRDQLARIGEKGPEAIIPLKNGSVPVTISAGGLLGSMAQPDIDPAKIEAMGKNMSNNVGAEIRAALNDLKISLQATAQPRDDVNQQILAELQDMTRMQKTLVSSNQRIAQAAVN
jgi:muramidase (phage lysozyme)